MVDYSEHTVLIVDDEVEILKSLSRGLHSEAYSLIFATSGMQALEAFVREDKISVLITDMRMPGMNGLELLKQVEEISPETIKIVLSGYTQLPQILATINSVNIYKFMTKPWDLEAELKVYIREAIDLYENAKIEENRLTSSEKKGILYNKMLTDSYEKVDHVLKLYDELIKATNHHHLMTIQDLRLAEQKSQVSEVIQRMNDRMHYLNKVFELSRVTLKTFRFDDVVNTLEQTLVRIGLYELEIDVIQEESKLYYYDNFKMLVSMMTDLIELVHANGPQILSIKVSEEALELKHIVKFVLESELNERVQNVFLHHGRFVEAILRIVGGKFTAVVIESVFRIDMIIPISKKEFETLE
ncbi:MAG: hypothetical protein BGO41_02120 [Clostridiales bacterium 38-18]|nr:MAG: hypothetical protein BGO41_02120 [Clostridiales bacterium 38-18]